MPPKIRATINSDGVGEHRHNLYSYVLGKINDAIEQGYYIEAITLLESIIADRLESLCNEISNSNVYSYNMLGRLINAAKQYIISEQWQPTLNKLDEWRKQRNHAIHEMAKIEQNDTTNFKDRYASCKIYAENGKTLFREIDNQIRKYRKINK